MLLRRKQEAEGWVKNGATSEDPPQVERQRVIERLYVQNGNIARMRESEVGINPVKRPLAKLYLNTLWGKMSLVTHTSSSQIV